MVQAAAAGWLSLVHSQGSSSRSRLWKVPIFIIDGYSGEGVTDRLPELAHQVVQSGPDIILAIALIMAQPLKDAIVAIPIVALTGDPVSGGLAPVWRQLQRDGVR
jgi:ABC-type uncharacterized transport system substrate-binding protein